MYARYQAALDELTHSVLQNTDLSTLMSQTTSLVANTLAVAYSSIWELLPQDNLLMFRFGFGWREQSIQEATIDANHSSPLGCCVLSATPTVVQDWASDQQFMQSPVLRAHRVLSTLAVPISGQDQLYGSLAVDVTATRMFTDEEVHFLQAVANVLALAIAHVQTNQAIEERTRAIEAQRAAAAHEKAVLEERQRLARDLHDSVTQSLYGVTLHAEAARRLLAAGETVPVLDSLRILQDTAQEALDEMRLLIFELRPPILKQVGLVAALQARLHAVEGRANLQTKLIVDGTIELPSATEEALYRIAQEALNNALKHARAHQITVRLQQAITVVTLVIADDGIGFDPATAEQSGGMGLRGIRERATLQQGQIVIASEPESGTRLQVELPL